MEESTEKIISHYEKYVSILNSVSNKSAAKSLVDHFGDRLVISPRGLKSDQGGNPGDLVSFSLSVASAAKKISPTLSVPASTLVKVSLLHELGRLGDLDEDLYMPQDSDWHREKLKQNYKYNDDCSKMGVSHRTLWFLSHFGFKISMQEYLAILTSQGLHLAENQFYGSAANSNPIIVGLQAARGIVLNSLST